MKTNYINKLLRKALNETLEERAEELKSKLNSEMSEWDQQVTVNAQPSDIHEDEEYNKEACEYHKNHENFGPDHERTKRFCKGEIEEKLYGGQKKLDKNKNNKIDAEDFAMLRKEEMDETKDVCSECGGMMYEGECTECGAKMYEEMDEEEQVEGNAFTGALAKAKESGKDEFTVDGKKYSVTEEKWIQKTGMKKGSLHKKLGVPEGEKLSQDKLKSLKKDLMKKGEGDKKLSKEDSKLLKQVNLALTLKDIKESKTDSLFLTEDELIDLIENVIKEEQKAKGLAHTEKVQKDSKKENDDYIKSVTKKMKEYLKDGSKGEYDGNPKIFPKGNGELAKMDKKAYVPNEPTQEYIDNFTAAGLENLVYDEIHPNEEWASDNMEGSSRTGNNPEWANAVDTGVNKKRNKVRKDNLLGAVKQMAYNKAPQPIVDDSEYGTAGKFNKNFGKGAGKKASKILNQLESTNTKQDNLLNEEFDKMKNLMNYNKKTQ